MTRVARAAATTLIRLADVGLHGNGHMMMLEKNNMAIARVMAEAVERVLGRERREHSAQR